MNADHNDGIHHPYDKSYKLLLSSKRIFIELLQSFVDKGWVARIDEQNLTKVDKSYILQDFREKEADLVYQMRFKDQQVIFYVLVEMQSSVDFQMPYRLLLYMVEIWRDVLKNTEGAQTRKDFRLPAIVPIVLYNGSSAWTACRSFRESLDGAEWFGDELLDFKYILLDVHEYEEKDLLALSNLIGSVFLLEKKPEVSAFVKQLEELAVVLEKLPNDLFNLFQAWLKLMTFRGLGEEEKRRVSQVIDQYPNPKEASQMASNLEKAFEDFKIKAKQEGIEEGMEKGIEKGIEQGIEKGLMQVAQRMLAQGKDVPSIMEATGLTKEEVEKVKLLQ